LGNFHGTEIEQVSTEIVVGLRYQQQPQHFSQICFSPSSPKDGQPTCFYLLTSAGLFGQRSAVETDE
jgi:hypothetical protein